jgi:PAS domain S-box-containing protein
MSKIPSRYLEFSLNALNDLISIHDVDYRILWANKAFCDFVGKGLEDIVGKFCYDILQCGKHGRESCPHYNTLKSGSSFRNLEEVFYLGKQTPFLVSTAPFYDENRRLIGTVRIATDFKEFKKIQLELEEHKKFIQEILTNVPFGIVRFDHNYRVVYENPAVRKILGVPDEQNSVALNLDIRNLPEKQKNVVVPIYEKIMRGQILDDIIEYTSLYNKFLILKVTGIPVFEKQKISGVLLVYNDITEQKKLEEEKRMMQEELFQLTKIDSIGKLAGGIAHDFNNILTVISGNLDFLREKLTGADKDTMEALDEVRRAAERASLLTSQLLAFSRRQIYKPRVVNLNEIINNLEKMLVRLIGENIHLKKELNPSLKNIKADPVQIDQIIINLVTNSRDAISTTGEIIIKTENEELKEEMKKRYPFIIPGEYVLLSVKDNGCGMSDEVKSRIFEPFFTTKEMGKGTGLGLAVVYGIVKQNNGFIFVESEIGKWTEIKIYLPVTYETIKDSEETEIITPVDRGGKEKILVVEDEESVRKLVVNILKSGGYNVMETHSAIHALEMAQNISEQIDLLITDVVMPELSGAALAKRLKETGKVKSVLYMSGYTQNIIAKHGILFEGIELIEKPFKKIDLLKRVRKILTHL